MEPTEKNDLVDLLVAFLDGYDARELDDIYTIARTRLAMVAAVKEMTHQLEVIQSRRTDALPAA